ncbi:hypothetical protein HZS_5899, partial [Henneguya salminicola]
TLDIFVYHRNSVSNGTEYYKCANFKKEKCKTRIIIKSGQVNPTWIHTHNDENEINEYLVNTSKHLSKYPDKVYQALIRFLYEKFKAKAIQIPSRNQVYNRIGYLRGPSKEALLTFKIQPHNSSIAGRPFLQRRRHGTSTANFNAF